MKKKFIEAFGWYGAAAILLAYALVSFKLIAVSSLGYQALNLSGALGIVVDSATKKDYQPTVLNIVWAAIAAVAILSLLMR